MLDRSTGLCANLGSRPYVWVELIRHGYLDTLAALGLRRDRAGERNAACRSGTFVLQHSGTMTRGASQLSVFELPDFGTGQRVLAGTMTYASVARKQLSAMLILNRNGNSVPPAGFNVE